MKTVLLIDDFIPERYLWKYHLDDYLVDYNLVFYPDGHELIGKDFLADLAKDLQQGTIAESIDVVILDYNLGAVLAEDVIQVLQSYLDAPIMIMSGELRYGVPTVATKYNLPTLDKNVSYPYPEVVSTMLDRLVARDHPDISMIRTSTMPKRGDGDDSDEG